MDIVWHIPQTLDIHLSDCEENFSLKTLLQAKRRKISLLGEVGEEGIVGGVGDVGGVGE